MTEDQQRVAAVLQRMVEMVEQEADYAELFQELLDEMLEQIAMDDGFGTERQCDPRGDGRNGPNFNMWCVEGIDE